MINIKEGIQSKTFKGVIIGIVIVLVLAVVFQAGMFLGLKKAEFSGRLGENYNRIFGEQRGPAMPFDNISGGHGAVGPVIRVSTSTLIVAEQNNIEKIVLMSDQTLVRKFRDDIKPSGINVGDFVSVLGEANNQGEIDARFIRVMPAPMAASSTIKTN